MLVLLIANSSSAIASTSLMAASAVGVTLPLFADAVWKRSDWRHARRVYYSAIAAGACCMIPYLRYWNLLGYWFRL